MTTSTIAKIAAIDARIAKLQTEREALVLAAANDIDPAKLTFGSVIEFAYGKGDKAVTREGVVLGVRAEDKKPTIVRVKFGEGVDTEIGSIFVSAIKKVVSYATAE